MKLFKGNRCKKGNLSQTPLCLRQSGQAATEYMLIVAVVVIGLVAAASHFIPRFDTAVKALADNVSGWLTTNQQMSNAN